MPPRVLTPEAEQAVEDSGKEEDEGKEVAEELEVAVKHFEVRSTRWEVRSGKDGLRITNYEVGIFVSLSSVSCEVSPQPPKGGKISMSVREVSPVVARLPISLTSPRARILCIAVKLRPVWDGLRDYTYPTNCHLWFFRDSRVTNQPVPGDGAG